MGTKTDSPLHLRKLIDPVMDAIASTRPILSSLLERGDPSLESFTRSFGSAALPAIQDRSDYIGRMAAEVGAAQGASSAERVRLRLQRSPVVNTANHLSLESLPLTVQSMVLAALGEEPGSMLPVEACASIPADNVSFPPGLLLARRSGNAQDGKALRVPILDLSWKVRRQTTWLLDPYKAEDLLRAESKASELFRDGIISTPEHRALLHILAEVLATPDLLGLPTFREQVCSATPRLWDAWFTAQARPSMPGLAYTAVESVRIPLLVRDLNDPTTLANRMLFDSKLRTTLMATLDGIPGCWSDGGRTGGSAMFWEIGPDRRTFPLTMDFGHLVTGGGKRVPLEPASLVEGLNTGALMPTVFLSMALGLARGLVQIGGFNQIEYQAAMQLGLSRALSAEGYSEWAIKLATLLPPMLTAGLAGVVVQYQGGVTQCAGGVELIAHGGLTQNELEKLRRISLREAMALQLPGIARAMVGELPSPLVAFPTLVEMVNALGQRIPVFHL